MKEKELRQYCKDASLEISNMQHTIDNLQSQLKAKEEVIKEAREYIEKCKHLNWYVESCYTNDLLEILSKGEKE